MGKYMSNDSKHHQKAMHKTQKKEIKVTYISNPILSRACHASEFRSLVQQLTGKNSDDFVHQSTSTDPLTIATTATEEAKATSYDRSMESMEFDIIDYYWKQVAHCLPLTYAIA
ncbi:unnamed protein product [Trifolium pratense]|uniref:Uncharacterized protein n=1 Tax=Trifolium pratense TaxID=57577 RepID=A0ACB0IH49_TRIPR|nr:unnamed protein product [Trifolium pratense]